MKKLLSFAVLLLTFAGLSWAYDFSAVAPSGQTLYYRITGVSTVEVTKPGTWGWGGSIDPTGTLTIPSMVTSGGQTYIVSAIGDSAFFMCMGLTSVTLPNTILSIGESGFYNCDALASITWSNALTMIGNYAFSACNSLTNVTLPNSVVSVGNMAFMNCSSLSAVSIPITMTDLGDMAFGQCFNLSSVTYDADSCNTTYNSVFNGCPNIRTVVIENNARIIPEAIFSECSQMTSLTIGSSVTKINRNAFSNCRSLVNVVIPNSVTTIGNYAFTFVKNIIYHGTATGGPWGALALNGFVDGDLIYSDSTRTALVGCQTMANSVTIPNTVTSIGQYAFNSCNKLKSIVVPNSVTSIGSAAFEDCHWLTDIALGSSVTSLGAQIFWGCYRLSSITIDAYTAPTGFYPFGDTTMDMFMGDRAIVDRNIPIYIPCGSSASYRSAWDYFNNFIEGFGYRCRVGSSDPEMGVVVETVHPSCSTPVGVVQAKAFEGYRFSHWSNGDTNNPYTYTFTGDTNIVAHFVAAMPRVDTVMLYDTVTIQPTMDYYDLVLNADTSKGIVVGSGRYSDSTMVEIVAIPLQGYKFAIWSDGSEENPRHVLMTEDISQAAAFIPSTEGVTTVEAYPYTISAVRENIVVHGAQGQRIRIFDAVGRCLCTTQSTDDVHVFNMPNTGVYLVQIADHPATRVVVR